MKFKKISQILTLLAFLLIISTNTSSAWSSSSIYVAEVDEAPVIDGSIGDT
ncbi:MAG: hypothetical protein ACXAB7_21670 [Candidatus Kariarchaeaceae archaeon]